MDVFTFTSLAQVAICGIFTVLVLVRNFRSGVNLSFSLGMISLGCLVLGDYMFLQGEWNSVKWKKLSMVGEALFPVSWLLFSVRYGMLKKRITLFSVPGLSIAAAALLTATALIYPVENLMYLPDFPSERLIYLDAVGYYFYLAVVVSAIIAMVTLEGTLWASRGGTRWNIKYAVLGVGGMLGIFIFYYSHPVLYRSLDMSMISSRNAVFVVSTILLAAAFVRQGFLDVEIFVSRRVVFRSATLLVVGIYFIFLGIVGEGLRYFGEDLSRNLVLFLAFTGMIGLSVLFLSESFRRKARRFITDNFYRNRYEYKDEWLKFTGKLSDANSVDEVLEEMLGIMVETFGVRNASYWSCNPAERVCRLIKSTQESSIETQLNMNNSLIRQSEIGAIYDRNKPDARIEQEHLNIFEKNDIMVIIPVLSVDRLLGLIMLGESITGISYDDEDYELMLTFSKQGAYAIEKTALSHALAESKEMEAMAKVTAFVMHDLKNMTTSLSMLLKNAENHIGNPDFQKDMLSTIGSSVARMSRVMQKLSHLKEKQKLCMKPVDLPETTKSVVSSMAVPSNINIEIKIGEPFFILGDSDEIKKVMVNLIINAFEAIGDAPGGIDISVSKSGSDGLVKISDTGCGMSREFIEAELFKPFSTTKKGGLGIGMYHCRSIIESHGGRLSVESLEGKGTTFSLYLPLVESKPSDLQ